VYVCWHTVKRLTVNLQDDLDTRLRHEAARRETTVAEVAGEAIEIHLRGASLRHLIAAKAGRSDRHDTARRIEEILRLSFPAI
jgi:predicted transcriptional regulator